MEQNLDPGAQPAAPPSSPSDLGAAEELRHLFARAAAAADRAVGLWLTRHESRETFIDIQLPHGGVRGIELDAMRTLLRASVVTYVRELRESGTPPERMLVLVKEATGEPAPRGVGARELANDVVTWSIGAFFDH